MKFLLVYASAAVVYFLADRLSIRRRKQGLLTRSCPPPQIDPADIVVHGKDLGLTAADLHRMLTRRFPYYAALGAATQKRFLRRLQIFIRRKIFLIKDENGFREMPVLVSAAAVQLSFGLRHYLLPFYPYIRIYPREYFGDDLRVLAGNVQGNVITVAWNHLLQGFAHPADGANVGLHEMSHALYFQKLVVEEGVAGRFTRRYGRLLSECRSAFADEEKGRADLYSPYANSSLQEFWAESVELFFEKPAALQQIYPGVFAQLAQLLNQDPRRREYPVLKQPLLQFR